MKDLPAGVYRRVSDGGFRFDVTAILDSFRLPETQDRVDLTARLIEHLSPLMVPNPIVVYHDGPDAPEVPPAH